MDLEGLPAIDQHAHNLLRADAVGRYSYPSAFTEGYDPEIVSRHARHTLFFRRSLRDLARLLGCAPTEDAVLARRAALGLDELTRHCFAAARLDAILLDDGFLPDDIQPVAWHRTFVPAYRLLRIEYLAEQLLVQETDFTTFRDRLRAALDPPPADVVGFKSIAAYRTGLAIAPPAEAAVRERYAAVRATAGQGRLRLADKVLIDFLVTEALEVAAKHRVPLQLHTGFGDPDLDLRLASPLHLRPLLEDRRYRHAPLVLLHASYPFSREAGYLAAVYPQVYVDYGLAVPFLSVAGMREAVGALLELAPTTKLLYASDAHLFPELYYLGARWGRAVLGQVLQEAVHDGDLAPAEAEEAALRILRGNALELYRLPGP